MRPTRLPALAFSVFPALLLLPWLARSAEAQARTAPRPIQIAPEEVVWTDAPPMLPPGAKVAILDGNPTKRGPFTMRLKMPAGYLIPLHRHPADERVTVITGTVAVSFADAKPGAATPAAPRHLGPGSYYVNPTPLAHDVQAVTEAVLQVTGVGPWGLTYVQAPTPPRPKAGSLPQGQR